LNYPEYKKKYDLDVHVQIFKDAIKANGKMEDEEIMNLFNFIVKDITSC
jgi:hypothetical protein